MAGINYLPYCFKKFFINQLDFKRAYLYLVPQKSL